MEERKETPIGSPASLLVDCRDAGGSASGEDEFNGFFVPDADDIDSGAGKGERERVGVAAAAVGDGAAQEVVDGDGLAFGSLDGDVVLAGGDDVAAVGVGGLDAEGRSEVGNEHGVLCDDDSAWVVGVAVVPRVEAVVVLRIGVDDNRFVRVVEAFAGDTPHLVVVGDDAGIVLAAVVGTPDELDVVAEIVEGVRAAGRVGIRVGVLAGAVIDAGEVIVGGMAQEAVACIGGDAGVVVDGND